MSSRLFQEAREKRGLRYAVHTFGSSYRDTGLIGVYAGTSAADAPELVDVIAGEMKSLAVDASEDEVARARAQIVRVAYGPRTSLSRCEQIAAHMFTYGRILDTRELIAKIEAVDPKTVTRIAGKVLTQAKLSLAALGPMGALGSYDRITQRFA
ncbi:MAG: insulinase family protein [Rhodopseudomonas palustris]|nr:insulinase family protein [Rhodopseudomonas palustris]